MARIRSIKPQFFKDPDLADLPLEARVFYAGLWCQADREGRLRDEPKLLKVEIAPYDDVDAEKLLERLAAPRTTDSGEAKAGFIVRYQVHGRRYIWIPSFLKHQKPHHKETASEIPPPPGAPTESGPGRAQAGSNPVDSGFLFSDSGSVSSDHGEEPPVAPRPEPGGPAGTVLSLRIPKRQRPGRTLVEEKRIERDQERDQRSRVLLAEVERREQLRANPLMRGESDRLPPLLDTPEAQLAWFQERCHASPEEALDAVALVQQAQKARRIPQ